MTNRTALDKAREALDAAIEAGHSNSNNSLEDMLRLVDDAREALSALSAYRDKDSAIRARDAEIASLRQQVERLEKEKAELLDDIKCSFGNTNAALDDYHEALARAERAEAELARLRTVDDAMIERAFYANHDPRAEPSSVERSKLRKAITAALEEKA